MTDEDVAQLQALREQVQEATQMLEEVSRVGPPPQEMRRARRLYVQREQLAGECRERQLEYEAALAINSGTHTAKLDKLGNAWQTTYDNWDSVNQKYLALPETVRKAAEEEVWHEQADAMRRDQNEELNGIEI